MSPIVQTPSGVGIGAFTVRELPIPSPSVAYRIEGFGIWLNDGRLGLGHHSATVVQTALDPEGVHIALPHASLSTGQEAVRRATPSFVSSPLHQ